ncbi:chitinase [Grimontia hollisae]|uniref:chitinase n=1 Tax=Grimontia hollisae CIP 101886 TaxID=675812 RepID=D0I6Y3_GRIHO|nr:glycosyl hydrolase family 18 protein [Grimontia hollisae]AMG31419.1 chitinase [Grimontia hollisae]EEY72402.1 chitinase [Grimontia hollisae CIP 101886]STO45677.1 Chitinase A precursor [Grimontia hollisae]
MNKRAFLKGLITASLAGVSVAPAMAAPGAPTISWMETNFSIIEVNDAATAYKDLVVVKPYAEVPVTWDRWSGEPGDTWRVLLNGDVVHEAAVTPAASQKESTILHVTKGGKYDMVVELCSGTGAAQSCTQSEPKPIVVADTDGSHLDPLPMNVDPNNGNYTTPANTVVGAYFVEWGVYGRKFPVDKIPAQNLTHIIYGFVPICGNNPSLDDGPLAALNRACAGLPDYEVVIHDPWAAVQMAHPQSGQTFSSSYKGTYGQIMALKQRYPDLKILPSIGGWTLSDPFYEFGDKTKRDKFVASVKRFLQTWKFYDGVDIDWEYPGGSGANPNLGDPAKDGDTYAILMQDLRAMLDELSAETGRTYELTSAVGVGYDKIEDVNYVDAVPYMDYIFAMTYDYYGGWNNVLGHQTALDCGSHMSADECAGKGIDAEGKPRKGPAYTTKNGVNLLLEKGVPPEKLVVGAAMYGRGWTGVTEASMSDPTNPMTGVGNGKVAGSWEAGVIDYKDIVTKYINNPNVVKGYDEQADAPWVYDPSNGDLITYDDKRSVMAKGAYVRQNNFAGLFAWEIDADNGDILNAMQESLAGSGPVDPVNKAPIANAGADITVNVAGTVTLDGSASKDTDGQVVTYSWKQTSGPAVSLTGTNAASASADIPAVTVDTQFVFSLTVTDNEGATSVDTVVVNAKAKTDPVDPVNTAPKAVISAPATAKAGDVVLIDANGSSDAESDSLTYTWSYSANINATENGATLSFVAGEFTADTAFDFTVTVSDGKLQDSATATVTVLKKDVVDPVDPVCDNAWVDGQVYTGGDIVTHAGKEYKAKWWTNNKEPGTTGEWGVWKELGPATCQ